MPENRFGRQAGSDQSAAFANSAAAGTVNTTNFAAMDAMTKYLVTVYNPSAITDLTVQICNVEKSLGGADRDATLLTFTAAKGQTAQALVEGLFVGGMAVKVKMANVTVLGASDGFTPYVRIREV